ncbi:MAG: AAA family ATPase [Sinobacteraceae bacterium]|nr:AAA family ATPase [Nevskiaceae bacterium]
MDDTVYSPPSAAQKSPYHYIDHFREAIRSAGITPPDQIIPDGRLHRFPTDPRRRRDDAGWYVYYPDGVPAGVYGDWRSGAHGTWHADVGRELTPEEIERRRQRMDEARRLRAEEEERRRAEARTRAEEIWTTAGPAPDDHVYLRAKGVRSHGLRVYGGRLVVPVYDGDTLTGLQFIAGDGEKKFLTGTELGGCYYVIGAPTDTICVTEGYATAASIHEATGHAVAVAFTANNLLAVAQALRRKHPRLRLVVCADDDAATPGNPGLTAARKAAEAVDGYLAVPDFGAERPDGATDFNDLHRRAGAEAVRRCIAGAEQVRSARSVVVMSAGPVPEDDDAEEVVVRRASDIEMRPVRWLWPGRIGRGKVTMIAGMPGLGKSQIIASLAAIVTTGGVWPVDGTRAEPGNVVLLNAEDDASDTIVPRLAAAGADLRRCHVVDAIVGRGPVSGTRRRRGVNLSADLERIERTIRRIGDVAMTTIDPMSAYLGGVDTHRDADVRVIMAASKDMAQRCGTAMVGVAHLRKSGGGDAMLRITGSLAFIAAARAGYMVVRDPDDPDGRRRLFLAIKNNLGIDTGGLSYTTELHTLDGGVEASRVIWDAAPVTVSANEVLARLDSGEPRRRQSEIADWLRRLLAGGPRWSRDVRELAEQAGYPWRSVQRAAAEIGVAVERGGFGHTSHTCWRLAPERRGMPVTTGAEADPPELTH